MSKNLTVAALKLGDKFEFLTQNGPEAKSSVMVVTRNPSVNLAAGSCHFRYRPEGGADGVRSWEQNNSWNGTSDVPVRLLEAAPQVEVVAPTVEVASPKPEVVAPKVEVIAPKVETITKVPPVSRVASAPKVEAKAVIDEIDDTGESAKQLAPMKKKPVKKVALKKTILEKSAVKKAPRRRRAL